MRLDKNRLIDHHVSEYDVVNLFLDNQNDLWIGTVDQGVIRANNSDLSDVDQFFSRGASVTTQDINGGIWLTSDSTILGYISSPAMPQYSKQSKYPELESIYTIFPYADSLIIQNADGQLYVLFDHKTREIIPPGIDPIPNMEYWNFLPEKTCYDPETNKLWVTYYNSLQAWDGSTWSFLEFDTTRFLNPYTDELEITVNGRLIGSTKNMIYEVLDDTIVSISQRKRENIQDIEMDDRGRIWAGTYDGIWILEDYEFKRPADTLPREFYSKNNRIANAFGSIWIYQPSGHLFHMQEEIATAIKGPGNKSLKIMCHYVAPNGDLWFCSRYNSELYRIQQINEKFELETYDIEKLSLSNPDSPLLITDSLVYASTINGLSETNFNDLKQETQKSQMVVSELHVNHKKVPVKSKYHFPHNQNNISFSFDRISFMQTPLFYRYKMIGMDSIWVESEYPHVQYTNLDPGNYEFIMQVGAEDLGWSSPNSISITIRQPYWETAWFRTLYILGFILLLISIYLFRKSMQNKKIAIQQELNNSRQLALRRYMNPHFLFNSLNSVQYFILDNQQEQAEKFISGFSGLMRDYFEAGVNETTSIQQEMDMIDRYVKLEEVRLKKTIQLSYTIGSNVDINSSHIPSFIIQPIIENAVWHGLAKKEGVGSIQMKFSSNQEILTVKIIDNGKGISAELSPKKRSHSTDIVLKRLSLLSKQYNYSFRFNRINRVDEKNRILGCETELTLPQINK